MSRPLEYFVLFVVLADVLVVVQNELADFSVRFMTENAVLLILHRYFCCWSLYFRKTLHGLLSSVRPTVANMPGPKQ